MAYNESNGREPGTKDVQGSTNPYFDAVSGTKPPEIVEFEMNTDPYANMLPGISSIRAARAVGQSAARQRQGRRPLFAILALFLLALVAIALVAAVVSLLPH